VATRHRAVRSLVVACALLPASCLQIDVEGGGPGSRPALGRRDGASFDGAAPQRTTVGATSAVAGARAEVSKWWRAYQGFVAGAAKVSQLISFMCGLWLLFSSPFAIVFSVMTGRVPEVFLCGFLSVFGVLLAMLEVPVGAVQRVLQQYFFFAYTRPGRGALVVLIAAVSWVCTKIGFMTKAFVGFNALLTFYILNSQDRRFAQVDADAKAALSQASDELRGKAGELKGFTRMLGAFGLSGSTAPTRRPSTGAAPSDSTGFGGFDTPPTSAYPDKGAQQPAWPGSGGGGGGTGGA